MNLGGGPSSSNSPQRNPFHRDFVGFKTDVDHEAVVNQDSRSPGGFGRGAPQGVEQHVIGREASHFTDYTDPYSERPSGEIPYQQLGQDPFGRNAESPRADGTLARLGMGIVSFPIATVRYGIKTVRNLRSGVRYLTRPLGLSRTANNGSFASFMSVYSDDSEAAERAAFNPQDFRDPDFDKKYVEANPPCNWRFITAFLFSCCVAGTVGAFVFSFIIPCGEGRATELFPDVWPFLEGFGSKCVVHHSVKYMKLISIPIVACGFTWFHIWLALQMMFYPVKFLGLFQYKDTGLGIGWQGVVPRKAEKMAEIAFHQAEKHFMTPKQIFQRLDGEGVYSQLEYRFDELIPEMMQQMATELNVKQLYDKSSSFQRWGQDRSKNVFKQSIIKICNELPDVIDDVLDVHDMIVSNFTEDRGLLNTFFIRMGTPEFSFLENVGALMGAVFGILQVIIWGFLPEWLRFWFLPVFGFSLGIITNYIAIGMCFRPLEPVHWTVCGYHVYKHHGLFLRRQQEVCRIYSELLAAHFFNVPKLVSFLQSPKQAAAGARLEQLIDQNCDEAVRICF
jgi:uncharacterized membrane protein YheB (UPF0754 family)